MAISLEVKSSFEFSPALSAHMQRRIDHALRAHAAHIKLVVLRLSDVNGPRHGADDKLTRIEIILDPSGSVVTSARSEDVYVSVTRATARASGSPQANSATEGARESRPVGGAHGQASKPDGN